MNNSEIKMLNRIVEKGIGFITAEVARQILDSGKFNSVEISNDVLYIDLNLAISDIGEIATVNPNGSVSILSQEFECKIHENDSSMVTLSRSKT